MFKKGNPDGKAGRKKGGHNKYTMSMKNMVLEVFEKRGGVEAMLVWSDSDPTAFYKLCSKMIPQEVDLNGNLNLNLAELVEKARKRAAGK